MAAGPKDPPGRREARRVQLQELARTQLLDAAETVLGDKGVHAATIKEIAELAEYSVGSVYSFFEGKDDLVLAVLARRGDEMLDGIRRIVGAGGEPLDRIVALARFELGFFRERPAFARLYLRSSAVGDLLPDFARDAGVLDHYHEAMARTAGVLAEGQASGSVCDGPSMLLARVLSGIVTAYQAVLADDPTLALPDTHLDELVRRTFGRGPAGTASDRPNLEKGPA